MTLYPLKMKQEVYPDYKFETPGDDEDYVYEYRTQNFMQSIHNAESLKYDGTKFTTVIVWNILLTKHLYLMDMMQKQHVLMTLLSTFRELYCGTKNRNARVSNG